MPLEELSPSNQIRGNIGLYYVCFQLSLRGWNVMPTARNAQGPDVLIYSEDAAKTKTIQVKMVTGNGNVRLGRSNHVFGDFLVICRLDNRKIPECFVLKPKEVRLLARRSKEESMAHSRKSATQHRKYSPLSNDGLLAMESSFLCVRW